MPTPWDPVLQRLWRQSRFTSYFYQSVSLVENNSLPTLALFAAQRRLTLYYHEDFVRNASPDHLIGLLVHEMLHVVLNHQHRMLPGRNLHLQNLAQDMVINSYLAEQRKTFFSRQGSHSPPTLELPPGLPLIPRAYFRDTGRAGLKDVTWEDVYSWLNSQSAFPDTGRQEDAPGPDGEGGALWQALEGEAGLPESVHGLSFSGPDGEAAPTGVHLFGEGEASEQAHAGAMRVLRFIQSSGECRGETAWGEVAGLMSQTRKPGKLPWKARIKTLVDRNAPAIQWETAYSRFNKRYFDAGIYAPGRRYTPKPLITVAVDVSGSMASHPQDLETAFGVIEELTGEYRINLLCLDQELYVPEKAGESFRASRGRRPYFYQKGDWRAIRTGSKGATLFAPLFNQYLKGHREMVLVITDGFIYDLNQLRPYRPLLWLVPGDNAGGFRPPFGRAVAVGGSP